MLWCPICFCLKLQWFSLRSSMLRSSFKWSHFHTDAHTNTPPFHSDASVPSARCTPRRRAAGPSAAAAVYGKALQHVIPKQTSPLEKPTRQMDQEVFSLLSFSPEPHKCQLQLRVMCKMSKSFSKSATGKCKYLRAAALFSENCSILVW